MQVKKITEMFEKKISYEQILQKRSFFKPLPHFCGKENGWGMGVGVGGGGICWVRLANRAIAHSPPFTPRCRV
jgi:hypothetical protein